jgi:potassium-dependent mechanosensitive channel
MKHWFWLFFILNINGIFAADLPQKENETLEEKQQLWQQQLAIFEKQGKIPDNEIEQASSDVENYQLKIKRLALDKDNAHEEMEESKKAIVVLKESLEGLKKQAIDKSEDNVVQAGVETLQKQIKLQNERFELAEQSIPDTEKNLKELSEELKVAKLWQKQLTELNQKLQNQDLETRTKNLEKEYTESIQLLRTKLNNLSSNNVIERNLLETQIMNFQEQIQLNNRQLTLSKMTNQLQSINTELSKDVFQISLTYWHEALKTLEVHQQKLKVLQNTLQEKLNILVQNNKLAENRLNNFSLYGKNQQMVTEEKKLLDALITSIDNQRKTFVELTKSVENYKETINNLIKEITHRQLFSYRQLPDNLKGWENLLDEALNAPELLWKQIQKAFSDGLYDVKRMSGGSWLVFSIFSLVILLALNWVQKYIQIKILCLANIETEERSFLENNLLVMFRLLKCNLTGLALGCILVALVFIANFNTSTIFLVLSLMIIWLGIKLPIDLAWELLVSPSTKEEFRDLNLYQQLRWMFLLIGIFSSITILIHILELSPLIKEISDSIYMVFLMITVFPLLRIRNIFVRVMREKQVRRYWILIFSLSTLLFPLSVLAMGILGVIGYINLAWKVAHILTWFVFILTVWLIFRGYVGDIFEYFKEQARNIGGNYSLLWAQDILPILYRITLVSLFFVMLWILLEGFNIDWIILYNFLNYQVFVFEDSTIKVGGIIFSLMAIITVIWLSKWVRRITYRWIYVNIADVGIRNSLSAFTQYTIVLIGFLIALQLMGIKLTTLTIFAGALGVGLGFGLQNIASNFISGLLLLAERPLKVGDIVLIGNYEGEVKNIGIRSLMIITSDNKNVIIPNSELISRPFTNSTRNDNKVRVVLDIGTSYENDPIKVHELLLEILSKIPSVLTTPPPNVFLSNFGDSAVIFRLQYYVDFKHGNSSVTKSEILFAVWEIFQANNISMPYPQRDIHIRSVSPEFKKKLEDIHHELSNPM